MMHSWSQTSSGRLVALGFALACAGVSAQTDSAPRNERDASRSATSSGAFARGDGYSLLPWTRRGYVGLNVGRSDYQSLSCGLGTFSCEDNATHFHLYTGGLLNEWLGMEIGYLNAGRVERGGGTTRSDGGNISLVGRVPLGAFNLFGKVGATYGRTRVTANVLSGLTSGSRRGWGASYALGAGFDMTPASGVVLEWARHAFPLPGGDRRDVDSLSLGYIHRF